MAELTEQELSESCERNGITSLMYGQDFMETMKDTLEDNPGLVPGSTELKESVMFRMLDEEFDFGELNETDEELDANDGRHAERMGARCDIVERIASKWVKGDYTGKNRGERELAQDDCTRMVSEWLKRR